MDNRPQGIILMIAIVFSLLLAKEFSRISVSEVPVELYYLAPAENELAANSTVQIPPNDRNICDIVTVIYSDEEIAQVPFFGMDGQTIHDLNKRYPIECIRLDPDGIYLVKYKGETGVSVSYYDLEGNNLIGAGHTVTATTFSAKLPKAAFDHISVGESLATVLDVTNYGSFSGGEDYDEPPHSTHWTSDGYAIRFFYNNDWTKDDVEYENVVITDIKVYLQ